MQLFTPSDRFIRALFKYHKKRKTIKRSKLDPELIVAIRIQIGMTFRLVLNVFAFKSLLIEPKGVESVILVNGPEFSEKFAAIINKKLGINKDKEGDQIRKDLTAEFKIWLEGLEGFAIAEDMAWPFKVIRLLPTGSVIMELNHDASPKRRKKQSSRIESAQKPQIKTSVITRGPVIH